MPYDAIVLAGGRSSRLGGTPKSSLRFAGHTLLERTLAAVTGAESRIVVGPASTAPPGVIACREDPPFAGPVAALAAGLAARPAGPRPEAVVLLACDMPHVAALVGPLLDALAAAPDADGVLALDAAGREQPLAACYRRAALERALTTLGDPRGRSMSAVTAGLALVRRPSEGLTDDVDGWADAHRLGVLPPRDGAETAGAPAHHPRNGRKEDTMADDEKVLAEWADSLREGLGVDGLEFDVQDVLGLAGRAAHAIVRPAAPLTTFVAGYAAGLATAGGTEPGEAVRQALEIARGLCAERAEGR